MSIRTASDRRVAAGRVFARAAVVALGLAALLVTGSALAEDEPAKPEPKDRWNNPAAHAPYGVIGDHTNEENGFTVGYRLEVVRQNGTRNNDEKANGREVRTQFTQAPLNMDLTVHTLSGAYSPIERLTVMASVPYYEMTTRYSTGPNVGFTTYNEGIGDFRLAALVDLFKTREGETNHAMHAQVGLSFPTGSITENDSNPTSASLPSGSLARDRLPYTMQIGSGTYDFLPALTYRGFQGNWGWGVQGSGEIRMNETHANYRRGNEYALTAWGNYRWNEALSFSLRADFQHELNYRGRDAALAPIATQDPNADPGRRTRIELDLLLGATFAVPSDDLKGLRFAVEAGIPAYQWLDGPQLENDYVVNFGVEYSYH